MPQLKEGKLRFDQEERDLIRRLIAQQCAADDFENAPFADSFFEQFMYLAETKQLDPLQGHLIFTVRRSHGDPRMVPITTIDAYRLVADRTGTYSPGSTRTEIDWAPEEEQEADKAKRPEAIRVYVRKLVGDTWTEFCEEARWDEFYPGKGTAGSMYRKFPTVMLAKCAEARAIRRGWPAEIGPLRIQEEMHQADDGVQLGTRGREDAEMPAAGAGLAQASVTEGDAVDEVPGGDDGPTAAPGGFQLPSSDADHLEVLLTLDALRGKDLKQQAMYIFHACHVSVSLSHQQADMDVPAGDVLTEQAAQQLRHFSTRDDGGVSLKGWDHLASKVDEGSKAVTVCYGRLKKWVAKHLSEGSPGPTTPADPAPAPPAPETPEPDQASEPAPEQAPAGAQDAPGQPQGAETGEQSSKPFELQQTSTEALQEAYDWVVKKMEQDGLVEPAVRAALVHLTGQQQFTKPTWSVAPLQWEAVKAEALLRQPGQKDYEQGQGWTVEQARDAVTQACEAHDVDYQAFLDAMVVYFGLQDRRNLNRAYCIAGCRHLERIVEQRKVPKADPSK